MEVATLKQILQNGLPCDHLDVDGDGRHFQVTMVSALFRGKGMVQRHQMVYELLGNLMVDEDVHALALKTITPEDWAKS
ncbi:MAG: BolA family transcriptional regulator [Magnetococcales bacterium]|nr:BolA family transcriptional regulator [Magnetococcales bacterium]